MGTRVLRDMDGLYDVFIEVDLDTVILRDIWYGWSV